MGEAMQTVPDFEIFSAIIEAGSFSSAAAQLNLTKSAVSHRITRLEKRLGVLLLQRSTRKLSLTEAGARYLAHANQALHHAQAAEQEASQFGTELIGDLRLHAPMSFGVRHIAPLLPQFLIQHPKVSIDLILDDAPASASDGRYDIALRASALPSSAQITRSLAPLKSIVCASPDYVRKHGFPTAPAELASQNCILFSYSDNQDLWEFKTSQGPERINVSGNLKVNNSEALSAAAVAGGGIARLPTFIAGALIAEGQLVRLLPEFEMPSKPLSMVFSDRKLISRSTRALVDFLVSAYGTQQPYWDVQSGN